MKFGATQRYDAPAEKVVEWYSTGAVARAMPALDELSQPDIVDVSDSADGRVVAVRFRLTARLPAAATAIIDPKKVSWVERTVYRDDLSAAVQFLPDNYADKLRASATVRFVDDGTSCRRTVSGDLKVHVLLVGSKVERIIVDHLNSYLAAEEDAVRRHFIDD